MVDVRAQGARGDARRFLRHGPMLALLAVTAAGAVGIGGGTVRVAFGAIALVTGIVYYMTSPTAYFGFALALWFLAPMLRRVVDAHVGYDSQSIISVVPLAVSAITAIGVVQRLPGLLRQSRAPFLLIAVALCYGFVLGLLHNGVQATVYTLGTWLIPVVFGLDIALHWRRYEELRELVLTCVPWAVLITGVYGVFQWAHPPVWDKQWMIDALPGSSSFGSPEPYQVRVFSTLNGPAAFAIVMGATLLLLLVRRRPWYAIAGAAGGLAFLLSLCRTGWIAWIAAAAVFAISLPGRARFRMLAVGTALALAVAGAITVVPLASNGRLADIIAQRMSTLATPTDDPSLIDRQASVGEYIDAIVDRPEGYGFGATGVGTDLGGSGGEAVRNFDNGVLEAFYSLGLFGGLFWMAGLGLLIVRHALRAFPRDDPFANGMRAVVWMCLITYGFTNTAVGVGGIVLWSAIGLCAVARDRIAMTRVQPWFTPALATPQRATQVA